MRTAAADARVPHDNLTRRFLLAATPCWLAVSAALTAAILIPDPLVRARMVVVALVVVGAAATIARFMCLNHKIRVLAESLRATRKDTKSRIAAAVDQHKTEIAALHDHIREIEALILAQKLAPPRPAAEDDDTTVRRITRR